MNISSGNCLSCRLKEEEINWYFARRLSSLLIWTTSTTSTSSWNPFIRSKFNYLNRAPCIGDICRDFILCISAFLRLCISASLLFNERLKSYSITLSWNQFKTRKESLQNIKIPEGPYRRNEVIIKRTSPGAAALQKKLSVSMFERRWLLKL